MTVKCYTQPMDEVRFEEATETQRISSSKQRKADFLKVFQPVFLKLGVPEKYTDIAVLGVVVLLFLVSATIAYTSAVPPKATPTPLPLNYDLYHNRSSQGH
jgi:hypothetical protein